MTNKRQREQRLKASECAAEGRPEEPSPRKPRPGSTSDAEAYFETMRQKWLQQTKVKGNTP